MNISNMPVILAAAVITYLTRYTGLSLGKREPPPFIRNFLSYIPIAAFAALVAPDVVQGGDEMFPRLLGAGIAALIAYRVGKLWVCIAVGMKVYWLLRALSF